MAKESQLWQWLSGARVALRGQLQMERIENLLGAGTPDVEGYVRITDKTMVTHNTEAQFWLELKSHERPARADTPIRFPLKDRENQIAFLRRRWDLGGNAFFLVQVGSGHERRLYLLAGDMGRQLQAGMTESDIAVECAAYGCLPPKMTPAEVLIWVATCRTKLSRLRR